MRLTLATCALVLASLAHADVAPPPRPAGPSDEASPHAPMHLAADDAGYYFAARDGAVMQQRAGHPPELLVREAGTPRAIAAGGGYLAWASGDGRTVRIVRLADRRTHVWKADGAYALAVDRAGVAWLESASPRIAPANLVTAGAEDLTSGIEGKVNLGVPRTVARDLPFARAVAVDGDEAFVAHRGAITAVPRAGGSARQLCLAAYGSAVVVDGGSVYFTDEGSDLVARVARAGGSPERLAGLHFADAIAVGSRQVFASGGDGQGLLAVPAAGGASHFVVRPHHGELAVGGGALYFLDGRGGIGRSPL